mgnify:CR=1 FL=1
MKWIGQHIYDFVSRFRNDAIFEYYSHNTVGDSNRTTTINGDSIKLANSSNTSGPLIDIRNTANNNTGATVDYYNLRANPADGDVILLSRYIANNDNGDAYYVGQQLWRFEDVSDGAEKGFYGLSLAAHNSAGLYNFFEAEAKGSNDIDVKIALGSASTTTVRGDLTVSGGDISLGGTGRIQGIDTVTDATDAASKAYVDTAISGTVGAAVDLTSEVSGILPVANGGTGASSLTDNKLLTGTGTSAVTAEANATYDGTDFTLLAASQYKPILQLHNQHNSEQSPSLVFLNQRSDDAGAVSANGDEAGKITFKSINNRGVPSGGAEDITYAEAKGSIQSNVDGAEHGKFTVQVAENNSLTNAWEAYGSGLGTSNTFGNGGLISYAIFNNSLTQFTSSVTTMPMFSVHNYTSDATAPTLDFANIRGGLASGTAGQDGDDCGTINFRATDGAGNTVTQTFASIFSEAIAVANGGERGRLELKVAEYDGTVTTGLKLDGQDQDGEVDVTIGAGAASTTTVAGDLSVTTGLILDSVDVTTIQTSGESFADNDTSLMTSAAIDDRINAAGGGADEVVSTGDHILKQTKVTIDTAGFNGLNSTPVELVAAQGANKVIVPTEVILFHDRATTQTNSVDLIVAFDGSTSYLKAVKYMRRYMQNVATDRVMDMGRYAGRWSDNLTDPVNTNLTIALSGAPTTNCVTSLTVYTSYYVIDIS